MQRAQVKFFDEKRGFGFLDSTDRVFFHAKNYVAPTIVFDGRHEVVARPGEMTTPPKASDWVRYQEETNAKGVAASAWTFDRDWRAAEAEAALRPVYYFVARRAVYGPWRCDTARRGWTRDVTVSTVTLGPDCRPDSDLLKLVPRSIYQVRIMQRINGSPWALYKCLGEQDLFEKAVNPVSNPVDPPKFSIPSTGRNAASSPYTPAATPRPVRTPPAALPKRPVTSPYHA